MSSRQECKDLRQQIDDLQSKCLLFQDQYETENKKVNSLSQEFAQLKTELENRRIETSNFENLLLLAENELAKFKTDSQHIVEELSTSIKAKDEQ